MNDSLKIGDVVMLKNGENPTMVVAYIDVDDFIECSYFQRQKEEFITARFHKDQLMK
jgi:uncharacterized protein YodC (DUF2158 family)